jgi:hypothetical protein
VIFFFLFFFFSSSSLLVLYRRDQVLQYFVFGEHMSDFIEHRLASGQRLSADMQKKFAMSLRSFMEKGNVTGAHRVIVSFRLHLRVRRLAARIL